jgi:lyase family enzyme
VFQIREALVLIEADLNAAIDATAALARAHRDTPMARRSILQQAVPITFGFKMATLLAAFMRHEEEAGLYRRSKGEPIKEGSYFLCREVGHLSMDKVPGFNKVDRIIEPVLP